MGTPTWRIVKLNQGVTCSSMKGGREANRMQGTAMMGLRTNYFFDVPGKRAAELCMTRSTRAVA